jgi:hypothetical protein
MARWVGVANFPSAIPPGSEPELPAIVLPRTTTRSGHGGAPRRLEARTVDGAIADGARLGTWLGN